MKGKLDFGKKTKKLKKAIVKGFMKPSFLELYKSLDKSKLTKKVLIDKHGHKTTRWVKIVKLESKPVKQTETKEFKAWFGDSKVVDKKGEPLVVYRGQKEDLGSEFKYGVKLMPNKATTNEFAFFFTDNTQTASDYAGDGNITPVYIKSEKILDLRPLGFSPTEKQFFEYIGEKGIVLYKKKYSKEYTPMYKIFDKYSSDLKYDIISAGFDGVIFLDSTAQGNTYAVFSDTQIKSATGNNGKFDTKNPDITKCIVRRKLFFK